MSMSSGSDDEHPLARVQLSGLAWALLDSHDTQRQSDNSPRSSHFITSDLEEKIHLNGPTAKTPLVSIMTTSSPLLLRYRGAKSRHKPSTEPNDLALRRPLDPSPFQNHTPTGSGERASSRITRRESSMGAAGVDNALKTTNLNSQTQKSPPAATLRKLDRASLRIPPRKFRGRIEDNKISDQAEPFQDTSSTTKVASSQELTPKTSPLSAPIEGQARRDLPPTSAINVTPVSIKEKLRSNGKPRLSITRIKADPSEKEKGFKENIIGQHDAVNVSPNGPPRPSPKTTAQQPPLKLSVVDKTAKAAGLSTTRLKGMPRFVMHDISYKALRCIGKGGSGRVYQVVAPNDYLIALKTVSLRGMNAMALQTLKGEVALLKKLADVDRVVRLIDWEINQRKETLYLELGQTDFESIIKAHLTAEKQKLDLVFVRHYWSEMLECVASIHRLDIVHSDLKPANFLLVNGVLKLIDFGIANTIQDDTVNIYRDHQVGTPNYMAPETLLTLTVTTPTSERRAVKFGKPSDIWSLGCILYLMVYGAQPFGHLQGIAQKALAITNPQHVIDYPQYGLGGVRVPTSCIRTMKSCLTWEQQQRPTASSLLGLSDGFLHVDDGEDNNLVRMSVESLETLFCNVICEVSGSEWAGEARQWSSMVAQRLQSAISSEE